MSDVYPGGRVDDRDPRYETLIRGFNLRWAGSPAYIQLCGDTEQVVRTVQEAVDRNLRITVRGGGHCYENFSAGNVGGVLVDMAPMNRVYYDDARKAFCIEGGCTLWNVYWNLYKEYNRVIPGGSCYSVGAGGHITGGGYGLLSRKHGLVVDWLTGVEIVTVDENRRAAAHVVTVDGDEAARDLLWANQGGGGGNFGIVTRFLFRELPAAPPMASIVNLAWNWEGMQQDEFTGLVERYGQFLERHSAPGSPFDGLFALFHLTQQAGKQIVLTAQYVGDEPWRLTEFVDFMHDDPRVSRAVPQAYAIGRHYFPQMTTELQILPWLYATQTFDGVGANQRGKYKSAYMTKPFPREQIDVLWQYLTDPNFQNPQALLQVDSYGCEINRVAPGATAVPQRSSIMKLQYQTYWIGKQDDDANLKWMSEFYVAMYGEEGPRPDGVVDGCYVNYPDCDLEDWQYLYYLDNYPRLQKVKAQWDPHNIFNHAQSIELP